LILQSHLDGVASEEELAAAKAVTIQMNEASWPIAGRAWDRATPVPMRDGDAQLGDGTPADATTQ
jgi:hypothetical protein